MLEGSEGPAAGTERTEGRQRPRACEVGPTGPGDSHFDWGCSVDGGIVPLRQDRLRAAKDRLAAREEAAGRGQGLEKTMGSDRTVAGCQVQCGNAARTLE